MNELKVSSFIAGQADLFDVIVKHPELRMVPIRYVETVRGGLKRLGYDFRIRYRGPHGPRRDTIKRNARAFTVYIHTPLI